jgi:hypothetical protein
MIGGHSPVSEPIAPGEATSDAGNAIDDVRTFRQSVAVPWSRAQPVDPEAFDSLQADVPEQTNVEPAAIVGTAFERQVSRAVRQAGDVRPYDSERLQIHTRLRDPLVDFRCRIDGRDEEAVEQAIDAGEWTDDWRAQAFLSRDDSVSPPLKERIRAWLLPEATTKLAIDRTVAAIEAAYRDSRDR